MPTDKSGKFHLNSQKASAADRAKSPNPAPAGGGESHMPEGDGAAHTTLHDHGDGSFHTETHDGQRTEHAHIGHALAHMHGLHGGGAKHMNVHSDGMSHTTHHHGGDGQVEGPHDHENIEALKEHMGRFLDEEASEYGGSHSGAGEYEPESESLHAV